MPAVAVEVHNQAVPAEQAAVEVAAVEVTHMLTMQDKMVHRVQAAEVVQAATVDQQHTIAPAVLKLVAVAVVV
jgi:hypothetical protein